MLVISTFVILLNVFTNSEAYPNKNVSGSVSNSVQVRIVGGKPAKLGDFPYQVFFKFYKNRGQQSFVCGGTLISDRYVLTAAHCVLSNDRQPKLMNYTNIYIGATNRRNREASQQRYTATSENFIKHFNYNALTGENDIALVKLPEAVKFNKYVQIAQLPSHYQTESELVNKTVFTSGWGILDGLDYDNPNVLHYMKTKVVTDDECRQTYNPHNVDYFSNSQICINSPIASFCDGDSGGPNVIKENNVNIIVGINSEASPNCDPGVPQILTKVSYYLDWISQNTGIPLTKS